MIPFVSQFFQYVQILKFNILRTLLTLLHQLMINGITRSALFQTSQSQLHHHSKLQTITSSKSTFFAPSKNIVMRQKQSKKRHSRARSFRQLEEKRERKYENRKMVMSMIRIATRQFPKDKSKKQDSKKKIVCSEQINRKKREKTIMEDNKKFIKNILRQKTTYPNQDSQKAFLQTREFLHRINKFEGLCRIAKNRSKSNAKLDWCNQLLDLGETMVLNETMKLKGKQIRRNTEKEEEDREMDINPEKSLDAQKQYRIKVKTTNI